MITLQVDVLGNGSWTDYKSVEVSENGYVCHLLPDDFQATWLRMKVRRDCVATAFLHQTANLRKHSERAGETRIFAGLADVDDPKAAGALVYPAHRNRNLSIVASDGRHFEFTKSDFQFLATAPDPELEQRLTVEPEFEVDAASVIVRYRGRNLRLPKGNSAYDKPFASGWPRVTREVESERHLANIHGTFYEVPLIENGQPPALDLLRPVASHSRHITDYCSWNGLLVLAGKRADARRNAHIFYDEEANVGLWFGGIDDLWRLGKPVGSGGPWNRTRIKSGQPSDPYLMTGYDEKTLTLLTDRATSIDIEIDFDHQSGWHLYKTVELLPDNTWTYQFPEAFSAHWIRFTADVDCIATAVLEYR
jgi:hypothetical protein